MTLSDGLIGTLGSIFIGSLLAGLVAIGLSPLAPLGPVRPLLRVGLHVDWTVVGLGVAVLLVSLSTLAVVVAYRAAPHRVAVRLQRERGSRRGASGDGHRSASDRGHGNSLRARARGGPQHRSRCARRFSVPFWRLPSWSRPSPSAPA